MSGISAVWQAMRGFNTVGRVAKPAQAMALAKVCEELPRLAKLLQQAEELRKAAAMLKDSLVMSDALKKIRTAEMNEKLVEVEVVTLRASFEEGSKAFHLTLDKLKLESGKISLTAERMAKRNEVIGRMNGAWLRLANAHRTMNAAHTPAAKGAAVTAVREAEDALGSLLGALGIT